MRRDCPPPTLCTAVHSEVVCSRLPQRQPAKQNRQRKREEVWEARHRGDSRAPQGKTQPWMSQQGAKSRASLKGGPTPGLKRGHEDVLEQNGSPERLVIAVNAHPTSPTPASAVQPPQENCVSWKEGGPHLTGIQFHFSGMSLPKCGRLYPVHINTFPGDNHL